MLDAPVLCRTHWQQAIMRERKTKGRESRLKVYREFHPRGATGQCPGKTWW